MTLLTFPWKTTIGTSPFLSPGGTTRAVLASLPQDPHGSLRIPQDHGCTLPLPSLTCGKAAWRSAGLWN